VTQGYLNYDIGVPLTLLRLRAAHRYAVIEMGANHPGEILYLSQLAIPAVAVITNAGPAHLEGFGSVEGVARAKAEIYTHLSSGGTAVINADDAFAPLWRELTAKYKRMEFGLDHAEADVAGKWDAQHNRLHMITPKGETEITLPLAGVHNARNALAAAAAALSANIDLDVIRRGLESMQPVKGRLFPRAGVQGLQILDDTYNANPASVQAALEVVTAMSGEAWLVLGDMGELGTEAEALHMQIGKLAKNCGVRRLFTLGRLSAQAAHSFGKNAQTFGSAAELAEAVIAGAKAGVNVLVKGSRAMHMEEVVAKLVDNVTGGTGRQFQWGDKQCSYI
jgi:UDP-N-acetylmuramoyl-tripeptide--D-alanyl-D-alanine ligase